MKTCKLYLPVVRTLEIIKIIDFNQADYTWYCVCCYFFGGQFRLVNHFDSEIVWSLSAYFGKTRSEIGYGAEELITETTCRGTCLSLEVSINITEKLEKKQPLLLLFFVILHKVIGLRSICFTDLEKPEHNAIAIFH